MIDDKGVLKPGDYFMMGNLACVEGAIIAGCRFYAGYPITPSSEIFERASVRFPQAGGFCVDMEDELGSMAALVGASYAGAKPMTATSGPGFSLMMENIGLAFITEAPCLIVNVQRAGPSTGIPTLVGQGDMMQARWGSHGDYEVIAYSPNSVQEMFNLTIKAFNAAEKFRTPVILLADQIVAMMWERLRIPPRGEIEILDRRVAESEPSASFVPYDYARDFIPMPLAGHNSRVHVDSLTHDEVGYPTTSQNVSEKMLTHHLSKIRNHVREIWEVDKYLLEDAEVAVIAYGSTSRSALKAVKIARSRGIKVGLLRLITPWPFPDEIVEKVSQEVKAIVVPEINYGQMVHPIRENAECLVTSVNHAPGSLMSPQTIVDALEVVAR